MVRGVSKERIELNYDYDGLNRPSFEALLDEGMLVANEEEQAASLASEPEHPSQTEAEIDVN